MISLAWLISLLLCVPQVFIFQTDSCMARFLGENSEKYPKWGIKVYVIWFAVSNFFIPLGILFFCYSRICYEIWENGKQKKNCSSDKQGSSNNCFKALTRIARPQWAIFVHHYTYSRKVKKKLKFLVRIIYSLTEL